MLKVLHTMGQLGWVVAINQRRTGRLLEGFRAMVARSGFVLSRETEERVRLYTMLIAITSHWFSLLRGRNPTPEEIDDALHLGAFTPVADDLMDDSGLSFEDLVAQTDNSTAEHVLFASLMQRMTALRESRPAFNRYFLAAHEAQNASLQQLQKEPLPLDYLEHVTYEKGGYYALLYRAVMQNPFAEGEEEFVYTIGAITQILNDLFDLHKDYHNGVQSIVTRTADMYVVARTLKDLEGRLLASLQKVHYPAKNRERTYRSVMAIVARGHVALEQFFAVQGTSPRIEVARHTAAELLVDMEKPFNVCKNVLYMWRATKSVRFEP